MNITSGKIQKKQKAVIYGPEGIGKSTLAAQFPDPLFIDTEGSTVNLDVKRFDKPTSWTMLRNQIEYVKSNPGICGTLVIDTMDWAERLCIEDICASHNKKGIEDFGYGNGYVYVAEAIGRFLNSLQELIDKNICHVVLTCHAQIKKFEQPNEQGAYDRYELKLGKKTGSQTAPLVKEWADMILFCNYKTFAVAADKDGKKFKGQGGKRVIYTEHHPCWDAKNRHGFPSEMDMDYANIKAAIEGTQEAPVQPQTTQAVTITPPQTLPQTAAQPAVSTPQETAPVQPAAQTSQAAVDLSDFEEVIEEPPQGLPPALRDLMRLNGVTERDIRFAVSQKGYFPEVMPVVSYPPDFIQGVLIGAWEQVYAMIKKNKELPFI